jgi:peptidoglycan/LPS O-acetylase OafA/YrhL
MHTGAAHSGAVPVRERSDSSKRRAHGASCSVIHHAVPRLDISRDRFYVPELDALRFVAFVGMAIYHEFVLERPVASSHGAVLKTALLSVAQLGGAFSVNLFLLVSSYLITRLARREIATTGRLDLRAFYIRRTLRIWPLYFFFLGLCATLRTTDHLFGYATVLPSGFLAAASFFVANWYLVFHGYVWLPALSLWTVSVEEQFYVTWPLLIRRASRERVRAISVSFVLVSHLTLLWLQRGGRRDFEIGYNTFTLVQYFGLGALMALWSEDHSPALRTAARIGLAAISAVCFAVAALLQPRAHVIDPGALTYNVIALFSAAGVVCLFRASLGAPRAWFPPWLLFLGRITYGLYIFNFFCVYLARKSCRGHVSLVYELALTVGLNLAFALAMYYLIERPFLRLKTRFEIVRSRAGG